jgi:hypothetical protein
VGKTGDKAAGVSQSPFDRLSKHLGSNRNNNALRRHLENKRLQLEDCRFLFCAHGPLFQDGETRTHSELCDQMSALEKDLADAMQASGYSVLNTVRCRKFVDREVFEGVRATFSHLFPNLQGKQ